LPELEVIFLRQSCPVAHEKRRSEYRAAFIENSSRLFHVQLFFGAISTELQSPKAQER